MNNLLFNNKGMHSVLENQKKVLKEEIENYPENTFLNTEPEALACYFQEKFKIEPIDLLEDSIYSEDESGELTFSAEWAAYYNRRDADRKVKCDFAVINIPFEGEAELFTIQPSLHSSNPPSGEIAKSIVRIKIPMFNLSGDDLQKNVTSELKNLRTYVDWQRSDIQNFNASLSRIIRPWIDDRRKRLLEKHSSLASLGFPIKRRTDQAHTFAPDVRKKVAPTPPPANTAPYHPEPAISMANYEEILSVIQRMAEVLERSPSAFKHMGEEDLRTHFIVQLNGQFEVGTTAETFNANGKSDIYLPSHGGNVFIAECKIWSGEKAFQGIFDQLFSYVTWRDTKTAILLFSRNKNFTEVVTRAKTAAFQHNCYQREMPYGGANGFRCVFSHPDDNNREVIVTTLIFDVPS